MEPLWTEKYRPRDEDGLVGHGDLLADLLVWIRSPSRAKPVYLWGPPGSGKTTLAHLVCRLSGYQLIEYNASGMRSKSALEQLENDLENASHSVESYFSAAGPRPVAVLLDEVDGIAHAETQNAFARWLGKRKQTVPLFLTSNTCMTKMRQVADAKLVMPPSDELISAFLQKVAAQEPSCTANKATCDAIASRVRGDIRQALVLLQFGADIAPTPAAPPTANPFGVLLHAKCPPELLEKGAQLCPWPRKLPVKAFPDMPADLPVKEMSMLSQWGLWRMRCAAL